MDREILFRGKRLDNGEWATGGLLTVHSSPHIFASPGLVGVRVAKCSVGQYIGIRDRNDVMIFEGDVVLIDELFGSWFGYVGYECGSFAVFGVSPDLHGTGLSVEETLSMDEIDLHPCLYPICKSDGFSVDDRSVAQNCEVIGNIFDSEQFIPLPGRYKRLLELAVAMEEAEIINYNFKEDVRNMGAD